MTITRSTFEALQQKLGCRCNATTKSATQCTRNGGPIVVNGEPHFLCAHHRVSARRGRWIPWHR